MKRITKGTPPEYFCSLPQQYPGAGWEVTRDISFMLRKHILYDDQHGLCAYTELRLSPHSSCSHIDHFRKRSLFREKTFEYNNLLVSCNSEYYSAKYKDKRITEQDYELLINPVEEDPRAHLYYTFTGKVLPRNHSAKGRRTIDLLNLNHPALVERRKQIALMLTNPRYRQLSDKKVVGLIGEMDSFIRAIRQKVRLTTP